MARITTTLSARHAFVDALRGCLQRASAALANARASTSWLPVQRARPQAVVPLVALRSRLGTAGAARLQALRESGRERAGRWARDGWACTKTWVALALQASPKLTPREVIRTTGLSRRQVYEGLRNGELPCRYTSGQPRIRQRDLETWMSRQQIHPQAW